MKISQYLDHCVNEIYPAKEAGWVTRLWVLAHGSRVSFTVSACVALLAAVDCLMKDSYLEASRGIRFVTGIFSCSVAQAFYVYRARATAATLRCMAKVARRLEDVVVVPGTLGEMERTVARCRRFQYAVRLYVGMVVFTVLLPILVAGTPSMPVWPPPTSAPALGATLTAQVITGAACPLAFYSLLGLAARMQVLCTALFRAAGQVVLTARGEVEVRDSARLHAELSQAAAQMDALTSDVFVFLMVAVMALPIQGTYDALNGRIDAYMLSSAPIIIVVFVPLCFTAQELSNASEAVGMQAYDSCWPEEPAPVRFMRVMVMVRAARPAQITCRGLGAIGLPACESAMKSWFSYLQMLLNVTRKSRAT